MDVTIAMSPTVACLLIAATVAVGVGLGVLIFGRGCLLDGLMEDWHKWRNR